MSDKKPQALTIGFDFASSLLEGCGGDYSIFGELIHLMLRYAEQDAEERDDPAFEPGTIRFALWPMARNQALHSLFSYNERVRKNKLGGTKTQIKNKLKSLGASDELAESYFTESEWTKYEKDGIEPKDGWKLREFISANSGGSL